ncbi:MAG: outer membrane beta-barrel protein [Candidatus Dadabacteria bacterium]|nr:outer membrane beta-barrel protein [Candidatus Dadabacteria bacterium]MDE0662946.1 outer membrane beta-barrel protein [Candidatus Dadabacteria bacterium]
MKITKNQKSAFWIFIVAVATTLGISANAAAQSASFYVGVSGGVQYYNIEHAKTVDNTEAPSDFLQAGKIYSTSDSASKTGFGGGLLVGYRLSLDPNDTLYLGIEVDGQIHDGTVSGTLPGEGKSQGRNQRGEAWPDKWSVDRKNSYGATLVLGANPPSLASLLGTGGSIYILGGVRRVNAEFEIDYYGCFVGDRLCGTDEFEGGTDSHDETFNALTFGGGVEKMIGGKTGIRAEARHTLYKKEDRGTFPDSNNIKVPVSLDGNETGFSIKAVVYF